MLAEDNHRQNLNIYSDTINRHNPFGKQFQQLSRTTQMLIAFDTIMPLLVNYAKEI